MSARDRHLKVEEYAIENKQLRQGIAVLTKLYHELDDECCRLSDRLAEIERENSKINEMMRWHPYPEEKPEANVLYECLGRYEWNGEIGSIKYLGTIKFENDFRYSQISFVPGGFANATVITHFRPIIGLELLKEEE